MSNGDLHGREREDLALHVERCAERYGAVQNELRRRPKSTESGEVTGHGALVGDSGAERRRLQG